MVRPRRKPSDTAQLKLRIREPLRRRLAQDAERNQTTLNAAIVTRIELGYEGERQLDAALDRLYGRQLAGVLTLLGKVMRAVGPVAGYRSMSTGAGAVDLEAAAEQWLSDPHAFGQAVTAARRVLDRLRPEGDERVLQNTGEPADAAQMAFGELVADAVLQGLRYPTGDEGLDLVELNQIRARLGPIVDRISARPTGEKESDDAR